MPTVLITGANRGIGLGFAKAMHEQGHEVIGTTREVGNAAQLSSVARVVELDVQDSKSVAGLHDQLKAEGIIIDILINNAGSANTFYAQSLDGVQPDVERTTFDVNVLGPLRVIQAMVGLLSSDAKVINISSRLASIANADRVNDPAYSGSKAALNMVTRQLSFDRQLAGKCIVSISPGWVRTRMGSDDAPLSVDQSVSAMLKTIGALTAKDNGAFLNYNGTTIPW